MEYYRWTTRELDSLILGPVLTAVCTEERHEHCVAELKGCASILTKGYMQFEGSTDEERLANRQRIAEEEQAKCRKVKVTIEETE